MIYDVALVCTATAASRHSYLHVMRVMVSIGLSARHTSAMQCRCFLLEAHRLIIETPVLQMDEWKHYRIY